MWKRIRNITVVIFLACIVNAGLLAGTSAGGPGEVEVDVDVSNRYVWRGLILTDDPVLQPSMTVSRGGLSLNVWANTDLTDVNGTPGEINELDYTVDYSFEVGGVPISLGGIQYTFPNTGVDPTTELYVYFGFDCPFSPGLALYYDVDEVGGLYGNFSLSRSIPLNRVLERESEIEFSVGLGYATSGWNEGYYGVSESGFVDFTAGVGFTVEADEGVSLGVNAGYSSVIDGDLRRSVADNDAFTYGASLSITF